MQDFDDSGIGSKDSQECCYGCLLFKRSYPVNYSLGLCSQEFSNMLKPQNSLFGANVVNMKPILKQLPKIFDHKDANVRQQVCRNILFSKLELGRLMENNRDRI
jgi:hypothetical protein